MFAAGALVLTDRVHKRDMFERTVLESRFLAQIRQLQEDNRSLTEALVRSEGKALAFPRRIPLERSPGWMDKKVPDVKP